MHKDELRDVLELIEAYRIGRIALSALASALDVCISLFKTNDIVLGSLLFEAWEVIEEVNAVALSENRLPSREEEGILNSALDRMETLVEREIG